MIKIRLSRCGAIHRPKYKIVAARAQSPRDGKFLAKLGYYDPISKEVHFSDEQVEKYLSQGAQMTQRVASIYRSYKAQSSETTPLTSNKATS